MKLSANAQAASTTNPIAQTLLVMISNGRGNLIIGYDELFLRGQIPPNRGGSHNLVIGRYHAFTSVGGLVAGEYNTISAEAASVSGGYANAATGQLASVSGGYANTATGQLASVSGGYANTASGFASSVSGGFQNTAGGNFTVVIGGLGITDNNNISIAPSPPFP